MGKRNNNNLLVLSNGFPDIRNNRYDFQYIFEYTNLIKEGFDNVYVIAPVPYIPNFFKYIPFLKKYIRLNYFKNYKINNVHVYYPKMFPFPLTHTRNLHFYAIKMAVLKTIKKDNLNFSLIHAHFLVSMGRIAMHLKNKYNCKTILTTHGSDIYKWPYLNKNNLRIAKKILDGVDEITAPSRNIIHHISNIDNNATAKTRLVSNFINIDKFRKSNKLKSREKLNIPKHSKVLLNVSNIVPGKGHNDLIDIVYNILNTEKNIILYIIGTGNLENDVRIKINKLKLNQNIILVGPIANKDLYLWYSAADLFVFPSYYESFGIVQIESLACQLPVIAYGNEGSMEIIVNESLGFVSEIGNVAKMKENIFIALKKDWDGIYMEEYVASNFSSKIIKKKLEKIYNLKNKTNETTR